MAHNESLRYEYRVDDFVWARMKSYPPWPGRIMAPKPDMKVTHMKGKQLVYFYGSENYAWIAEDQVWPYDEYREQYKQPKRVPKLFTEGVEKLEEALKANPPTSKIPSRARTPSPPRSNASSSDQHSAKRSRKSESISSSKATPPEKAPPPPPKRPASDTKIQRKDTPFTKRLIGRTPARTLASSSKSDGGASESGHGRSESGHGRSELGHGRAEPGHGHLESGHDRSEPGQGRTESKMDVGATHSSMISESSFMPDILSVSPGESLVTKNIMPTPAKIGFLGIGIMGSGMVENLLKSGHEVTIWNRNNAKCRDLVNEGALKGSDPAEVVQSCDIIFSCVSDGPALKDLVFRHCGVLQGISSGKGFVDLSTVDVESIQDVNEAIVNRGGRFLEAPVIGTKELSKQGQLLVLASGDKTLYADCYSCFQAIGRHMMFLGEIASATRMKLVLSLLMGTTLAGLAESLALADKLGLSTEDVLRVFSYTPASSPFLREKGADMIYNRFSEPSCKLQIMAKDLRLSVNMSDTVDQPLHVGAAVCELFKKAKAKGYGEHDGAAVYRAADL